MVEQFIHELLKERNIYTALEFCSDDIYCSSSFARQTSEGKENVLVMFAKILKAIPQEITYKITNIQEREITADHVIVYVEYDIYKEEQCLLQGRLSVIKTLQDKTWKINYIHSSESDIQLDQGRPRLDECIFNQTSSMLASGISFWHYDIPNKRIIHNKQSIEMHGFSNVIENVPESLIESGFVHPDNADDFREMYQKLEQGHTRVMGEVWVKPNHMDKYWCERIVYTTVYS